MTKAVGFDWYILIDGAPSGPVAAEALTALVMERKIAAGDLVWRQGLASWMPVGEVLGASERPAPQSQTRTHTIFVEAAERRETAHRVVSLSQLYVDRLADRMLAPVPSRASSGIVEAHDAVGNGTTAYGQPPSDTASDYASARTLAPPQQRGAAQWQPALVELARLVEVSEANAEWNAEWTSKSAGTALTVSR